ncbi:MAG: glutamate--tRNA ligase [bacterium]|nr:glutamate--tRNA ligase [bacterium]
MDKLNTRFPPSPTGYLHVGGARTAMFGYVMARKTGGQFVLRIEDTDRARHDESAVAKIIEDLHWLGINWDQGPDVGGDRGPYRQSERLDIYRKYVEQLLVDGKAYYAFDTPEELGAMRTAAQDAKQNFTYPRPDPLPSNEDVENARAEGRPVVVRFLCPQEEVTINDDAFGQVTMPADQTDDFIIQKSDTYPTYHLANVIDDALMGVNYIMRGQEFLGQSWRHKLLRKAMGFDEPKYCHLPLIMDVQGRKLSKRDGDVEVFAFRKAGYLPEAMVNYLALLGWNPGNDIERFSIDELIDLFSPDRLGKTNAKFDRDKLLAFNTDAIATASEERLLEAFKDYLSINDCAIPGDDDDLLRRILQANKGFRTFADIIAKSGILFDDNATIEYDPKAVKKWLAKGDNAGWIMLGELRKRLDACEWTGEAIEQLITDICEQEDVGMGKVAQPIRVAVTGRAVSPSIGETLTFLGKEKTLLRIDACLASRT